MTWLVATWIATVDVKADITGAETKLSRKPEKKKWPGIESEIPKGHWIESGDR